MAKVRIGYKDGSGPEYITIDEKPVLAIRWGCSCCKNNPDTFADLTLEEQALMKRVVGYLSRRNPKAKRKDRTRGLGEGPTRAPDFVRRRK